MQEQIGQDGHESDYAKTLAAGPGKVGKTVTIMANVMGVMPGQKYGGICKTPSEVHLIGLDQSAAAGVGPFFKMCGAPEEAYKFHYYKCQDDVSAAALSQDEWDYTFFNSMMDTISRVKDKCAKRPGSVIILSSLTTLALTLERGMAGPAGAKMGGGMDQSKWGDFARQLTDIRSSLQVDQWHMIWEGHLYKPPATGQDKSVERPETLQVSGKAGFNFPNNVGEVFGIRRSFGVKHEGTKIDQVYFDTKPSMDFIAGGRMTNEKLNAKEYDLTLVYHKLGYKIGFWGRKK